MAMPYEQATETYLAKALENGSDVCVDSPNGERSYFKRGFWYLRNFDGHLIARVGRGHVHFTAS